MRTLAESLTARGATLSVLPGCYCPASSHEAQLVMWQRCVYQTALLPLWQFLSAMLYDYGAHNQETTWAWEMGIHVAMLCHLLTASMALLALYLCCREHELLGLNAVVKFFALKSVVFGHAANKFAIAVYTAQASDDKVLGAAVLGGLTILQAELLAILFLYVYPASDPALEEAFMRQPQYTKVALSVEEASKNGDQQTAVSNFDADCEEAPAADPGAAMRSQDHEQGAHDPGSEVGGGPDDDAEL
jgi:hypothetical protein